MTDARQHPGGPAALESHEAQAPRRGLPLPVGTALLAAAVPLACAVAAIAVVAALEGPARTLPLAAAGAIIALASAACGLALGLRESIAVRRVRRRLASLAGADARAPERDPSSARQDALGELSRAADALQDQVRGELAMYRDALDEVQAHDRQKTDFLASVAKEIGAPLGEIARLAQRLTDGEEGPLEKAQRDDLLIVRQAAGRLLDLVQEITDFSSLLGGRVEMDVEPVDVAAVAREVVEASRGQLKDRNVEIALEIRAEPRIPGSRRRVWQIVTNLVGNAIKFTEEGRIAVAVAAAPDGGAIVEVADTGPGIPPRDHEAIFESFEQRGSLSKRRRGAGLGLAICRRLAELHGGSISVRSEAGAGSTFVVTLPGGA
jgi:signal transduction histidine kinase